MQLRILLILWIFLVFSCKRDTENTHSNNVQPPSRTVNVPAFNADSAYFFVKKQVSFGPRVPNTEAHRKTGDYLINTFRRFGAQVAIQEFESTTFDGQRLHLRNIIASFFPEKQKRILLASHWDTRPFADKDKEKPNAPFEGANDGASGVGVLLEIARELNANPSVEVGVDLILFDGEDWGERENDPNRTEPATGLDSWWCLGSQHWAKNKHRANYSAYYGILLDMVGAKNAQFHREGVSLEYAPKVVEKVWNTAEKLGYSHVFVKKNESEITDDHVYVNQYAKIPMIDITHYDPAIGYFGSFHHTRADNMDLISKETLEAVGNTLLYVLYYEEPEA